MKTRRSKSEIIMPILEAAMTGDTKAQIKFKANLSTEQAEAYLILLIGQKLLREHGRYIYKTTEAGIKLLGKIRELNELVAPIKPLIRNR